MQNHTAFRITMLMLWLTDLGKLWNLSISSHYSKYIYEKELNVSPI